MTDTFLPLDGGGEVGVKGSCPRNLSMRHYTSLVAAKGLIGLRAVQIKDQASSISACQVHWMQFLTD